MNIKRNTYILWGGIVSLFAAMLVIWGYTFGHENSIQLIPLALHSHDPSLFAHDFYVSHAAERFPNERSFFLFLLYPFGLSLEWPAFILFTAFSLLLLRSLIGIAQHITGSHSLAFGALIILIFPFNFHALGMNELFSRELTATLVSDATAAFALWMFLRMRLGLSYTALIISTLMHPLAGLQMFMLITGTAVIGALFKRDLRYITRSLLIPIVAYSATAMLFIIRLHSGLDDTAWDDATFFQYFFVFRNAHHYIPTAFPHNDWIMLTPIFLLAPILLWKKHRDLAILSLLIITGCIFYSIGVLELRSVTIATAQWFKSTMWLECIGVCALLGAGSRLLTTCTSAYAQPVVFNLAVAFSVFWMLTIFPTYSFWGTNTAYEFPFYLRMTPEIDISQKAMAYTPKDALFIQPAGFDELKYYSHRSSYVDYKALTHTKGFIREWADRFRQVYLVDPGQTEVISFDAVRLADAHFRKLTAADLSVLHQAYGITHVITFADTQLPYPVLAENAVYKIYQL